MLGELENRRTELLERRIVELDLAIDPDSPNDAKVLTPLDRLVEERRLADSGLPIDDEDGPMTVPRRAQQPLEHRALALPAEQPPGVLADTHPGSMPPRTGLRVSGIRSAA